MRGVQSLPRLLAVFLFLVMCTPSGQTCDPSKPLDSENHGWEDLKGRALSWQAPFDNVRWQKGFDGHLQDYHYGSGPWLGCSFLRDGRATVQSPSGATRLASGTPLRV